MKQVHGRQLTLVVLALLTALSFAWSQDDPRAYLEHALDLIEEHSVREEIDWDTYRAELLERAEDVVSLAEAHDLIDVALERLDDDHSFLRRPPASGAGDEAAAPARVGLGLHSASLQVLAVYPGSPAARAGLARGDRIVAVDGESTQDGVTDALREAARTPGSLLRVRSAGSGEVREVVLEAGDFAWKLPPDGYLLGGRVAVLELPTLIGATDIPHAGPYARVGHDVIERFAGEGVCGWIVDLRLNSGGNMWPMLAAVGPILGEGELGAFLEPGGRTAGWTYEDGAALADGWRRSHVPEPYELERPLPPVAVLTSDRTRSSGEAVAVAFRGRDRTRFFGEATNGVPTANLGFPLPDGARLILTSAWDVDRLGRVYRGPIEPHERVVVDWSTYGTPDDPVLRAARAWLEQHVACRDEPGRTLGSGRDGGERGWFIEAVEH